MTPEEAAVIVSKYPEAKFYIRAKLGKKYKLPYTKDMIRLSYKYKQEFNQAQQIVIQAGLKKIKEKQND